MLAALNMYKLLAATATAAVIATHADACAFLVFFAAAKKNENEGDEITAFADLADHVFKTSVAAQYEQNE